MKLLLVSAVMALFAAAPGAAASSVRGVADTYDSQDVESSSFDMHPQDFASSEDMEMMDSEDEFANSNNINKMLPLGKLRGAVYLESDSHIQETSSTSAVKITENDMDTLVEAFCRAAVSISDAFWDNGGKSHSQYGAYPQAACDAAYEEAFAALSGAYNYPGSVLFKPTLTTAPYTFRPTKEGALSYFIGTDCLLKSGNSDEQFPPGNNGSTFREYGFGLANYGTHTGISDCKWVAEGYVTGENAGIAQGKVIFERTEGGNSVVDKTFSFGVFDSSGGIVITGHHSSSEIEAGKSTQYVIGDEDGGGGFQIQRN